MITKFKLFESGEWDSEIDLQYVLDNPNCEEEECEYINAMKDDMTDIKNSLSDSSVLDINDIVGIDLYQGVQALITAFGYDYKVSYIDEYESSVMWIENFPVDNTSEDGLKAGFAGGEDEIVELFNDIISAGGDIDVYVNSKKFNI